MSQAPNIMPGTRMRCTECSGKKVVNVGWLWWKDTIACPQCHGRGYGISKEADDGLHPPQSYRYTDYGTAEVPPTPPQSGTGKAPPPPPPPPGRVKNFCRTCGWV